MPVDLTPLATQDSTWDPTWAKVALNVTLDGCIVPTGSQSGGARVDVAHLVVLDDFISDTDRASLLEAITEPGWDHTHGPPLSKWEKKTRDVTFASPTWGLKDEALRAFAASALPAKLEVHSRLCRLYPELMIAHMPSDDIQHSHSVRRRDVVADGADGGFASSAAVGDEPVLAGGCSGTGGRACPTNASTACPSRYSSPRQQPSAETGCCNGTIMEDAEFNGDDSCPTSEDDSDIPASSHVDCHQFVGNAAVVGDVFSWHQDADPSSFPPSEWTNQHGLYFNREPGRPLFVSLLLYLNPEWPREWDAETLFLDGASDTGVVVRPKPCRAVLMDQDVLHRLSPPSHRAGGTPRYSLVWKLVMLPRRIGAPAAGDPPPPARPAACAVSIARPEWGSPVAFGSADKVAQAARRLKRRAEAAAG